MKKLMNPPITRFSLLPFSIMLVMLLLILGTSNSMAQPADEAASDTVGILATTTYFFDWGAIPWVDPPNDSSYPWVQTFTIGSNPSVDVTVTIPRQQRFDESIGHPANTDYIDTIGNDLNTYAGSSNVLRFWHPDDALVDQIIVSFSRPVQVNNLVFGGNRLKDGVYGTLEFKSFSGPSGTGVVMLPNDLIHADPSTVAVIYRGTPLNNPASAALTTTSINLLDPPTAQLNGAYVDSRKSYVTVGTDENYNWGIIDYQNTMIQSFSWELYSSSVSNPLTARDNLIIGLLNSAYIGSFSFTVTDFDYGDLADGYSTTFPNNGAAHAIGNLYLGSCVDAEFDGIPNPEPFATGDDIDANSGGFIEGTCADTTDEDGIVRDFSTLWQPGNTVAIDATITGGEGNLGAWIDWNGDGIFNSESEEFIDFGLLPAGTNTLSITIPTTYTTEQPLNVRFRLFDPTGGTLTEDDFEGTAVNGEVEDYYWTFGPTAVTLQNFSADNTSSLPIMGIAIVALLALVSAGVFIARREQKQA